MVGATENGLNVVGPYPMSSVFGDRYHIDFSAGILRWRLELKKIRGLTSTQAAVVLLSDCCGEPLQSVWPYNRMNRAVSRCSSGHSPTVKGVKFSDMSVFSTALGSPFGAGEGFHSHDIYAYNHPIELQLTQQEGLTRLLLELGGNDYDSLINLSELSNTAIDLVLEETQPWWFDAVH